VCKDGQKGRHKKGEEWVPLEITVLRCSTQDPEYMLPKFRRSMMTVSSDDYILRAVQTDYPEDLQQFTPKCRYLTVKSDSFTFQ